jgi:hypothetical protein
MSLVRRMELAGRTWRAATTALCLHLLAACADGYPSEDAAQIEPARMTKAQLLAALNELGEVPQLRSRWRYTLHPQCELEVSERGDDAGPRRVAIEGAELRSRSADGMSQILLVPAGQGQAQAVTLLETREWSDVLLARSLLTHLERQCEQEDLPAS